MKIENSTRPTGAPLIKETRSSSTQRTKSARSDEVQLSELSSQLRTPDDESAFDAARVSEIKQAIAEGRFTINAGAIADRLITSTKELLNSQRQV